MTSLRQDIARTQETSVRYEVANQQLKGEQEMLQTANRRLQVEADIAKKDYNLQLQMLSNLQTIQVSIRYGFRSIFYDGDDDGCDHLMWTNNR